MNFSSKNATNISIMKPARRNDPDFPAIKNNTFLGVKLDNKNAKTPNLLIFGFKNDRTGDIYRHRELSPENLDSVGSLNEEAKTNIRQMLLNRLVHIAGAFVADIEDNPIVGDSWVDFCNNLIARVNQHKDTKCDLKLVYPTKPAADGKYYASFPLVPDFISTELKPKVFTANPQYELYELPQVSVTPDANPVVTANDDDDSGETF